MVRPSPTWCKASDLYYRANGRKHVSESSVGFIERIPLALKNWVQNSGVTTKDKACMPQLNDLIVCIDKFESNQAMCKAQMKAFEECYSSFRKEDVARKEDRKAGKLPVGPHARLSGVQMNQYMKNFPQSQRKGQFYLNPKDKKLE